MSFYPRVIPKASCVECSSYKVCLGCGVCLLCKAQPHCESCGRCELCCSELVPVHTDSLGRERWVGSDHLDACNCADPHCPCSLKLGLGEI